MRFFVAIFLCGLGLNLFGQDSTKVKRRVEAYANGGVTSIHIGTKHIHPKLGYNFNFGSYYAITDRIDVGLNVNFSKVNYSSSVLEAPIRGYLVDTTIGPAYKNYSQVGTTTYKISGDLKYISVSPMIRFLILRKNKLNLFFSMNLFSAIRSSSTYKINTISAVIYPIEHTGNSYDYGFYLRKKSLTYYNQLASFSLKYKIIPELEMSSVLCFDQSYSQIKYYKGGKYYKGHFDNTNFLKVGFNVGVAYNFNVKASEDIFKKFDKTKINKNAVFFNRFGVIYERKLFFIRQLCFSQSVGIYRGGSGNYIPAKITATTLISYGNNRIFPQIGFYYYKDFVFNGFYHKMLGTNNFAATLGFSLNLTKHFFVRYSVLPIKFTKFNYDVSRYQTGQKTCYFNEHFASFGFSF